MKHPRSIETLIQFMAEHDPIDRVSGLAALQLMPRNADQVMRLELASALAVAAKTTGRNRRLRTSDWHRIVNGSPLGEPEYTSMDDPFNNLFTEPFTFHGGSFGVFSEPEHEFIFVLRYLAEAIVKSPPVIEESEFNEKSLGVLFGVLCLSNEVIVRAGLSTPCLPINRRTERVIVPDPQRMQVLQESLIFTEEEINDLLKPFGHSLSSLHKIIFEISEFELTSWDPSGGPMLPCPIGRHEDKFIIALPHAMLSYARHAICSLAIEHGTKDQLINGYKKAAMRAATRSFEFIKNIPLGVHVLPEKPNWCEEQIFSTDSDKLTHLLVAADELDDYEPNEPFSAWMNASKVFSNMEMRAKEVRKTLFQLELPPNDVLHILALQSFGRAYTLAYGSKENVADFNRYYLPPASLEIISFLEGGNPLAFWQFLISSDRLRNKTRVFSFSPLEEYSIFRDHDHSFYLDDDSIPDLLSLAPGGIKKLREEISNSFNIHGVPGVDRKSIVDVALLYGDKSVPIYAPLNIAREVQLLVDALDVRIWVTSQSDPQYRHIAFLFADLMCYWIWQIETDINEILQEFCKDNPFIHINLHILPDQRWYEQNLTFLDEEHCVETSVLDHAKIHMELAPSLHKYFDQDDNLGERILVDQLLTSFQGKPHETRKLTLAHGSKITNQEVLDKHAPLGRKKKLLFLSSMNDPVLVEKGLPPEREVQGFNRSILLDELGNHLHSSLQISFSEIQKEQRNSILKTSVAFFFNLLEKKVSSLNCQGLLEFLISQNERNIYEQEFLRSTLPTRIECFGTNPTIIGKLSEEISNNSTVSVANRFLIEYVAAQPPIGDFPISLSVYDNLLALACLITDYGSFSDLDHFGLATINLEFLPSHRLGINIEDLPLAMQEHRFSHALGEIEIATNRFDQHWRYPVQSAPPTHAFNDLEEASKAEFGFSISEIFTFLNKCYEHAIDRPNAVFMQELGGFRQEIAKEINWNENQVEEILELFVLRDRSKFLEPGKDYSQRDVYPWRFNRGLSHLRKPFVIRALDSERQEILYGPRMVHSTGKYLLNLCLGGKLKAKTEDMKRTMSRLGHKFSEEYNQAVADFFKSLDGFKVRKKVMKVKGKLIARQDGNQLGDIDVLALDTHQQTILVIEAKDIGFSGNPAALANEMKLLFGGEDKEKSTVSIHLERKNWIENNKHLILEWFDLDPLKVNDWGIEPLIVVDQELISPYLKSSPLQILSFRQLRENYI